MIVGELHLSISWAEFDHNICDFAFEGHLDAIYCIAIPAIVDILIDYASAESLGSPGQSTLKIHFAKRRTNISGHCANGFYPI